MQQSKPSSLIFGLWMIVLGALGWIASLELTLARFQSLEFPDQQLGCDFGILVNCSDSLAAWQGRVFFDIPNTLFGLAGFAVIIVIGAAIIAGAKFAPWFWGFWLVGVTAQFALTAWFQYQSIFVIGSLCPWCIAMWFASVPIFFIGISYPFAAGVFKWRKAFATKPIEVTDEESSLGRLIYRNSWLLLIVYVLIFFLLAQMRLEILSYIFI
ncbi:MAG: hypothetical protein KF916_05820 [Microbacteriaceae bacterium]|nr:hypothetical protein [Microbacteriaceae bacterium]